MIRTLKKWHVGPKVYAPPPNYVVVGGGGESELLFPPSTFTLNGVTEQPIAFAYLQPKIDYSFGYAMKITQITESTANGGPFTGSDLGHGYHTENFWNANETLLKIGQNTMLDGSTYARIGTFGQPSNGTTVWSKTRPEILYVIGYNNSQVLEFNVLTKVVTRTVIDLASEGYTDLNLGNGTGIIGGLDEYCVLIGMKSNGTEEYISLNLTSGAIRARILNSPAGCPYGCDWITVSAKCGFIIASPYLNAALDGGASKRVYDLDFNFLRSLTPYTHSNPGTDPAGNEVLYSMNCKSTNLSTGVTTTLLNHASTEIDLDNSDNGHATGIKDGWGLMSVTTPSSETKEIFFVKGDGSGEIRRFCHTRRGFVDYGSEPHASCNKTGTKVIFTSNNNAGTAGQQKAFICEVATAADIAAYA